MKKSFLYKSIDPYYSDQTQTFIGMDETEINNQISEFNEHLGRNHPSGIEFIYKIEKLN